MHLSTSQRLKVVRTWCLFSFLTSKSASRHNGVQLFISHLPRWLRTRRFSEPTFRPSGATKHWKNTVFRDFSTFSRTCIFFLLILLFFDLLPSHFLFSSHLCFSLWSSSFSLSLLFPPLLPPELLPSHFLFSDSSHLCSSICPYCRKFDF